MSIYTDSERRKRVAKLLYNASSKEGIFGKIEMPEDIILLLQSYSKYLISSLNVFADIPFLLRSFKYCSIFNFKDFFYFSEIENRFYMDLF